MATSTPGKALGNHTRLNSRTRIAESNTIGLLHSSLVLIPGYWARRTIVLVCVVLWGLRRTFDTPTSTPEAPKNDTNWD